MTEVLPAAPNSDLQLRMKVAACTQILVNQGIMNYSGHVSARLPGREAFLIQPIDQPRSGLRPEHLLICDYDGKVLDGPAGQVPPAEVSLHGEILRARKDVNSVAHFHHDLTNSFTLVEGVPLRVVKNHAVRWKGGIPVHADPAHVANARLGRSVVETLGEHHALQIRAHGQVITAESVDAVLNDSVHFVENAQAMYNACAIGRVVPLSEADIESFELYFRRARHVNKLWRFYVEGAQNKGVIPKDWDI